MRELAFSVRPTSSMTSSTSRGRGVEAGGTRERFAHRQVRVGRGALQHDADLLAPGPVAVLGILAEHLDVSARRACRKPSRISRVVVLPAPFGPEQGQALAFGDAEAHALHGVGVAVTLAQAIDDDRCHACVLRTAVWATGTLGRSPDKLPLYFRGRAVT